MAQIHVSLSYHRVQLDVLDVFAVGVRDGIFGNVVPFAVPPITQANFQTLIDDYINTRGAYVQGGLAQKGPFLAAKTALVNGLDTFAVYVDGIADGNQNIIFLSGFVPTKPGSTAAVIPGQPVIKSVTRGVATEMFAECNTLAGADGYGCIVMAMPMPPNITLNVGGQLVAINDSGAPDAGVNPPPNSVVAVIDLNKNRKKHFLGLQPHVVYYFYFYAVNASGVSVLSAAVSMECL